ncbi:MAG TPA: carboxypeptidase-like regulatory domain-containing protein, partial [Niabella sp.]|nr:carboxypeptidase-like regulatory domain-containing protein [Niabella sp.]
MKERSIAKRGFLFIGLFLMIINAFGQTNTGNIEGTVTTTDGKPVQEVNIFLKELKKYARTDEEGHFKFRHIPFGRYTILYSFAVLSSGQVNITVPPEEGVTTVYQLPLNTKELEEVTITYKKGMNRGKIDIG